MCLVVRAKNIFPAGEDVRGVRIFERIGYADDIEQASKHGVGMDLVFLAYRNGCLIHLDFVLSLNRKLTNALRNLCCGRPTPLTDDLPPSYVYFRPHGVFKCKPCAHPALMSLLFASRHGLYDGVSVAEKFRIEYPYETADRFLRLPGTAFRSSMSEIVQAWEPKNLEEWELRMLGEVYFVINGKDFRN